MLTHLRLNTFERNTRNEYTYNLSIGHCSIHALYIALYLRTMRVTFFPLHSTQFYTNIVLCFPSIQYHMVLHECYFMFLCLCHSPAEVCIKPYVYIEPYVCIRQYGCIGSYACFTFIAHILCVQTCKLCLPFSYFYTGLYVHISKHVCRFFDVKYSLCELI